LQQLCKSHEAGEQEKRSNPHAQEYDKRVPRNEMSNVNAAKIGNERGFLNGHGDISKSMGLPRALPPFAIFLL